MSTGDGTPPGAPPPSPLHFRQSRWRGEGYADVTKLREIAARHQQAATRAHERAARLTTKIERIRHQATVLREKAQAKRAQIPEVEQEIQQLEKDLQAALQNNPNVHSGTASSVSLATSVSRSRSRCGRRSTPSAARPWPDRRSC